jgi:hypothetical protein
MTPGAFIGRHLRHLGRARIADAREHLGRREVRGVRQPLHRLVAAAQHRQPRTPPRLQARVLLGGRGARERAGRRRDERPEETALEQTKQAAKVVPTSG